MAIYYVSLSGNDSDPGTILDPWGTVQYAVKNVIPGDTIMVRGGVYNEALDFSVSGQADAPITLAALLGEPVTINGGTNAVISDLRGTRYWAIEGFTLESDAEYVIDFNAWNIGTHYWIIRNNIIIGAVKIHGSYNLFEGNEVDGEGTLENGVWDLYDPSHHNTYRNNDVHDFILRGFWSMHRTHHNIYEGNHVHHIQGHEYSMGIDLDGYGSVVWEHTIKNNRIHDCDFAGVEVENAFASTLGQNTILNGGRAGVIVINYAEGEEGGGYGGNNCLGLPTDNLVWGNLVAESGDYAGVLVKNAGGVAVLENEIYDGAGPGVFFYTEGEGNLTPGCEVSYNWICGNAGESIRKASDTVEEGNIFEYREEGSMATLKDGESYTFENLGPGTYEAQITVPTGWKCDDSSCPISLQAGEDIDIIVYPIKLGSVTVTVETDPPGSTQEFEITLTKVG